MSIATVIALTVAGFLLLFFEIFVPGGILGVMGCMLVAIAIGGAFVSHGALLGGWLLIGSIAAGFAGFYLWVKLFPRSRIGQKAILQEDAAEWHGFDDGKVALVGLEGQAHTPLRPAGIAIIEGKRVDVVTRGEMVPPETRVRVIKVEGNRVVVTGIEPAEGE